MSSWIVGWGGVRGVTLFAAALLAPADESTAAQGDDEGIVTIEPVLSAEHEPGDHVPLRVAVSAGRLFDGVAVVSSAGTSLEVRRDLEVAGGASKELLVLLPTSESGGSEPLITVELVDGDEVVANDAGRLESDADTDVAGVLPALLARTPELPPRITLPVAARRVNLVALTHDILRMGPAALDQLDSIVGTSSDLAALDTPARAALLAWLDHGGRLLLDDSTELSVLPATWRPDVAGYALAGGGEVRLVDGAATAGRWSELLDPGSATGDEGRFMFEGPEFFVPSQVTLGQRAGVRLPDLNVLVIVLVGYVVVIGPILYLVLRRLRRLNAAWLAIPAVAVVTAAAVVVAGSAWRSSGRPTANVALQLHPGGATASADVLLFSRGGGAADLRLPAGWTIDEPRDGSVFGLDDAVRRIAEVGDVSSTIEATLEAGQLVVLNASGPVVADALDVDVRATGDGSVAGTVRNAGTRTLRSTAVLARGGATLVGDLVPGEERSFNVEGITVEGDSSVADLVWSDPTIGVGFAGQTPAVDFGLWSSFSIDAGARLYPSGMVRVAGWLDDRPADVQADRPLEARTLVTAVAPIGVDVGASVPAIAVRSSVIQPPFDLRTGEPNSHAIYRFVVPPAGATGTYELTLPNTLDEPEVWLEGAWAAVDRPAGADAFAVPPTALRRGVVLVRVTPSEEFGGDPTLVPILAGVGDA